MYLQQRQDLQGQINIISIDENPFPKEIESVPSMVVGNELWNLDNIYEFLNQPPQQQQPSQQQQQQQQQQQPQQQQQQHPSQQQQQQHPSQQQSQPEQPESELEGYCENGVCGLGFASIDGNDSLSGLSNYSLLDDTPNSVAVENDGHVKKNDRADKFDSEYEQMMKERGSVGMSGPPRQ